MANVSVKGKYVGSGDTIVMTKGGEVELDGSGSHDNGGVANMTWRIESEYEPLELYGERPPHVFERSGNYNGSSRLTLFLKPQNSFLIFTSIFFKCSH